MAAKKGLSGMDKRAFFQTTHWTEVARARTLDKGLRREAMESLCRKYWAPVYSYLRRKGCSADESADLSQGFFHDVVLKRGLVQQADPCRGRFRAFILAALDNYVRSARRGEKAAKRRPEKGLVSLEALGEQGYREPSDSLSPDQAFQFAWASALLDDAIRETRAECLAKGMGAHWEVFSAEVLAPTLDGAEPPPLAEMCRSLGIRDEAAASNMLITMKRMFRRVIRGHVAQIVADESQVDDEIADLMRILSERSAG